MSDRKHSRLGGNWLPLPTVILIGFHIYANFLPAPQTVSSNLSEAYGLMWQQPAPLVTALLAGACWAVCSVWASVAAGRQVSSDRKVVALKQGGIVLVTLGSIGSTTYVACGFMSSAVYHATPTFKPYLDQVSPYLIVGGLVSVSIGAMLLLAAHVRHRRRSPMEF